MNVTETGMFSQVSDKDFLGKAFISASSPTFPSLFPKTTKKIIE